MVISLCRSKKETKRVHKSYEITVILAARCYKSVFPNIFSHMYPLNLITKAQVPFNNTKLEKCLLHLVGNHCCTSYSEIQIYIFYIISTFIMLCFRAVCEGFSEMKSGISPSLYPTEMIKIGLHKFSSWSRLVYTDLAGGTAYSNLHLCIWQMFLTQRDFAFIVLDLDIAIAKTHHDGEPNWHPSLLVFSTGSITSKG